MPASCIPGGQEEWFLLVCLSGFPQSLDLSWGCSVVGLMATGVAVLHYRFSDMNVRGSVRKLLGSVRIKTNLDHLDKERVVCSPRPWTGRRVKRRSSERESTFSELGLGSLEQTDGASCVLPGHGGLVSLHFLTQLSRTLHILLWKVAALRDFLKSLHNCIVNGRCNGNVVSCLQSGALSFPGLILHFPLRKKLWSVPL